MPIRGATRATSAGSTAVSITPFTGTGPGDVVIIILVWNDNANTETVADNNGSTPFTKDLAEFRNTTTGHDMVVYSRRLQAGDPSSYAFTLSASERWTAIAISIRDPHPSAIYDVAPASGNAVAGGTTNPVTVPSITTVNDKAIHFSVLGTDGINNTTASTPAGYIVQSNGGEKLAVVSTKVITPAGATGTTQYSDTLAVTKTGLSFSTREPTTIPLVGACTGTATATATLTAGVTALAAAVTATASVSAALTVYYKALMGFIIGRAVLGEQIVITPPPITDLGFRTRIMVTL